MPTKRPRRRLKRQVIRSRRYNSLDSKLRIVKKRESLSSVSTALSSPKRDRTDKDLSVHLSKDYSICFDSGVQRYYFRNRSTSEKLWKLKRCEENNTFLFMDEVSKEMHEWQLCFHYTHKRYFFYNHDTKYSCWVLPVHEHLVKLNEHRRRLSLTEALACIRNTVSPELSDSDSTIVEESYENTFGDINEDFAREESQKRTLRQYNSECLLLATREKMKKHHFSDTEDYSSAWSSDSD